MSVSTIWRTGYVASSMSTDPTRWVCISAAVWEWMLPGSDLPTPSIKLWEHRRGFTDDDRRLRQSAGCELSLGVLRGCTPKTDNDNVEMLLYVGVNPMVSHGHNTGMFNPAAQIRAIAKRGEVWTIDPSTNGNCKVLDPTHCTVSRKRLCNPRVAGPRNPAGRYADPAVSRTGNERTEVGAAEIRLQHCGRDCRCERTGTAGPPGGNTPERERTCSGRDRHRRHDVVQRESDRVVVMGA